MTLLSPSISKLAILCLYVVLAPLCYSAESEASEVSPAERKALRLEKEKQQLEEQEAKNLLAPSDETSKQILRNSAVAVGVDSNLLNVVVTGEFNYHRKYKKFKLIETADGKRWMRLTWRSMGREYTETVVSVPAVAGENHPDTWREVSESLALPDGAATQKRIYLELREGAKLDHLERYGQTVISYGKNLRSKELTESELQVINGAYAEVQSRHFQNVFLFMQPFFQTRFREQGYQYQGTSHIADHDTYLIQRGTRAHYHIDQEKFLLLQWGGQDLVAEQLVDVDYRGHAFKRWRSSNGSKLLPSVISIMITGTPVGSYTISEVEFNATVDASHFVPPEL